MTMRHWTLSRGTLASSDRDTVAGLLLDERIVVLPTDTIYGLHGLAMSARVTDAMRAAKRRQDHQPFVVLCADVEQMALLGVQSDDGTLEALARLWPAPLTAILPLRRPIPVSSGKDSIGVRIPDVEWLRELIRRTGPLASTSANLAGETPMSDPSSIPPEIAHHVAGVVDGGALEGQPSTLVQFTEDLPQVLREGAFTFTQNLWKTVRKSL